MKPLLEVRGFTLCLELVSCKICVKLVAVVGRRRFCLRYHSQTVVAIDMKQVGLITMSDVPEYDSFPLG
jgi:hypothetical protein